MSLAMQAASGNALPPLPPDFPLKEGDEVEMPVYPVGTVRGRLRAIDVQYHGRRYKGLVLVAESGIYYELRPEIARLISRAAPDQGQRKNPPRETPRRVYTPYPEQETDDDDNHSARGPEVKQER